MKPLSQSVLGVSASGIRKFFDLVSQMEDVISLGVGEPDFVTPLHIRQAAISSIEAGRTGYTSNYGLLDLREAIAQKTHERTGAAYDPQTEILVTVGVSEALDIAFRALLNPGDEVLVPQPCYVSYVPCIRFAGGVPVFVPTDASDGFKTRPDALRACITPRTKAILLSYPTNPTGATMNREALQAVMDVAREHDLYVISDEIYDRLSYDAPHASVASLDGAKERTVFLNGFSKAYAMTGWRIGYACAPAALIEVMMKIHQYTMLCAPITAQIAALEALQSGDAEADAMTNDYHKRRNLFVAGLNEIGLPCPMPGGAFYAFPSIADTGLDCDTFTERLLHEERVLVIPGNIFGEGGNNHVRCCYATATGKLEEALVRMERFVKKI